MPRILAVDWGERRIGLAISDPTAVIASGLDTLDVRGRQDALERLAGLAAELSVDRFVVGLPLLLSGREGEAAGRAREFAQQLAERTGLPVDTLDERLTSALSERRLRESRGSKTRGRKRAAHTRGEVDRGAAIALLETYLARLRTGSDH